MRKGKQMTERDRKVAELYMTCRSVRMVTEQCHTKERSVRDILAREDVQSYMREQLLSDCAGKEEIMWILSSILRGTRCEEQMKVVHKKEAYYDEEGRKCTRDDEVLQTVPCQTKVADLWRAADLLCRLGGYIGDKDGGTGPLPVFIEGSVED